MSVRWAFCGYCREVVAEAELTVSGECDHVRQCSYAAMAKGLIEQPEREALVNAWFAWRMLAERLYDARRKRGAA